MSGQGPGAPAAHAAQVPPPSPPALATDGSEGSRLARWAGLGFVLACLGLFGAASLIAPVDAPGFPLSDRASASPDGTFEVTLDVRDAETWIGIDLDAGGATEPGLAAEIVARRYVFQAPGGAVDLGPIPLMEASIPADARWIQDSQIDGVQQNAALARWYEYGYTSHLLSSKGHTYALRSRSGERTFLVRIVSYYCEPEGSGCLTLRYRYAGE